jgi:hypothetical protein
VTYVVVSSGHLRGLSGLGSTGEAQVTRLLSAAEEALERLSVQRNRLGSELTKLRLSRGLIFDPFEMQARIDSLNTYLSVIDDFVRDRFIKVERKAKDAKLPLPERVAAAQRLLEATTKILRDAGDTDPLKAVSKDIKQLVNDITEDVKKLDPNVWEVPVWAYGLGVLAALAMVSSIVNSR